VVFSSRDKSRVGGSDGHFLGHADKYPRHAERDAFSVRVGRFVCIICYLAELLSQ